MRTILLLILALVSTNLKSQVVRMSNTIKTENVSRVSVQRDTLWLIDDDLGRQIAKSWDNVQEFKPVIIFVEEFPPMKYFYRIILDEVENRNVANEVSPTLQEIFKTRPIFFEEIRQFQIVSDEKIEIKTLIVKVNKKVTYFKCSEIQ